jgi:hypothetical protein
MKRFASVMSPNAKRGLTRRSICGIGGKLHDPDYFPRFVQFVGDVVTEADVSEDTPVGERK